MVFLIIFPLSGYWGKKLAWATTAQIRLLSGLTTTHISDADVTSIITIADREVARKVFVYHYEEILDGSIDGSNTLFRTNYKPIGDKDQSGSVLAADVSVYGITLDAEGFENSTSLTVSSVNARDGIITMSSAPASTYLELRGDYTTIASNVVMNDVFLASSYLAALIAMINVVNAKYATAPYSYTAGRFSITKNQSTKDEGKMQELWRQYQEILGNVIKVAEIQKIRPSGSVLSKSRFRGGGITGGTVVKRNVVGYEEDDSRWL